ncbi:hypothetical protein [Mesorhizobium sp.]
MNVDACAGGGVLPAFSLLYARKDKRMFAIVIEDGEFQLTIERSA